MRLMLSFAALFVVCAIIIGASSAHMGLEFDSSRLHKAKDYLFYHGLALLGLSSLQAQCSQLKLKGIALGFIIGTILFSGSLLLLSFTAWQSLAMLTPIGGMSLLLSWLALLLQARHL